MFDWLAGGKRKQALAELQDPDPHRRLHAEQVLAGLKSPQAVGPLVQALQDPESPVRLGACHALDLLTGWKAGRVSGKFETELRSFALVEELVPALSAPEAEVRRCACSLLGYADLPMALPALRERLEDSDPSVRGEAAGSLAKLSDWTSVPAIVRLADDPEQTVAARAVAALAVLGDSRGAGVLLRALRASATPSDRYSLAQSMSKMSGAGMVEIFLELIVDADADVRFWAASGLMETRDPRAVDALKRCLQDPDADVRKHAKTGLALLSVRNVTGTRE